MDIDESGDEDDPVVREIDVFLSQNMKGVRDEQMEEPEAQEEDPDDKVGGTHSPQCVPVVHRGQPQQKPARTAFVCV
mgnify:FL=1|jgi:hypothetical protein